MSAAKRGSLLTLEPLIDAVREGVEAEGWELSGLQKTTSHQFEGRWEGESTRSAYLFFHLPTSSEPVSIDVYLDETTRGLTGNIALVVDLVALGDLGDATAALSLMARLSQASISPRWRRPVTLRLRLDDAAGEASGAEAEVRFKIRIARDTIAEGADAIRSLAASAVTAFRGILASAELRALLDRE